MAGDLARAGIELPSLMNAGIVRWRTPLMPAHYTRNKTASRGAVAQSTATAGAWCVGNWTLRYVNRLAEEFSREHPACHRRHGDSLGAVQGVWQHGRCGRRAEAVQPGRAPLALESGARPHDAVHSPIC